jgi:hypothetical protein
MVRDLKQPNTSYSMFLSSFLFLRSARVFMRERSQNLRAGEQARGERAIVGLY